MVWTEDWYAWKGLEESDCQIFFNPRIEIQKPPPVPLVPNLDIHIEEPKTKATVPSPPAKPPPLPALSHLMRTPEAPPRHSVIEDADDLTQAPGTSSPSRNSLRLELAGDLVDEAASEQSEITQAPEGEYIEKTEITRVVPVASELPSFRPLNETAVGKQRQFHRYAVQLPVVIQSPVGEFRTWTVDVSEGGARLRDPLPNEIAGYNQITFFLANAAPITILASLVEDSQAGRVHVQFMDGPGQALFIHWMREQDWARAA